MKILIIEDEKKLSDSIVSYLKTENYLCEQAFDYNDALMKVRVYSYDCVLLDLMLPGGNGLDILRDIKQRNSPAGVIIISAKGSVDDKVTGLLTGADDYLSKPFHHGRTQHAHLCRNQAQRVRSQQHSYRRSRKDRPA